ncbi:MAG TPA: M24 family metallopeptidase [Alphaproteobacteria bacterium]|nr:M24 family metallopeptidase [Alphaproteobacteria bacterium]
MSAAPAASRDPYAWLPERLHPLVEAEYARFSDSEMARRRASMFALMAERRVDHLLVYGAQRNGSAIPWLTGWPTTAEAALVMTPERRDLLFVQYHNHVPLARRIAERVEVHWGGESTLKCVIDALSARGAVRGRVGIVGPLGFAAHQALADAFDAVLDLNRAYTALRLVKSDEEIDWLRIGAGLSDRAIAALGRELRIGLSERDLGDIVERAYVPFGGTTGIHYFGTTSMADPDCAVPRQFPSSRRLQAGDIVFCEISAAFWDYPGQILRSFALAAEPPPLYRDLHATASAAYEAIVARLRAGATAAELVEASSLIEAAGFTTCDDLVHGYGGGYLPPVLGSKSRPAGPVPDFTFEAGMTIVVQPNVVTRDGKAGVQTGELVRVTATGFERLHKVPQGFLRA